ncbi:MAG: hypothetical protein ABIF10_06365 [Candidatus Woesearchaeota archaeon]
MRGLLLLSGGIDSPVAGYMLAKRGVDIGIVHFTSKPYSTDTGLIKAEMLCSKLSEILGTHLPFQVIDIAPNHESFLLNCSRRYHCLLCKRAMYRHAERLAKEKGYDVLITGENIGQVASQTIENLACIEAAVAMPVLRPLLCNEKLETIGIAKRIGTYDISIMPDRCCSLAPKKPVTRAILPEIEAQESRIPG